MLNEQKGDSCVESVWFLCIRMQVILRVSDSGIREDSDLSTSGMQRFKDLIFLYDYVVSQLLHLFVSELFKKGTENSFIVFIIIIIFL